MQPLLSDTVASYLELNGIIQGVEEINLELKYKAAADKSDCSTHRCLLLASTWLSLRSLLYIQCMIKLGLSIDDDDDLGADDDLPPLEEVEGAADEASKMEEVD